MPRKSKKPVRKQTHSPTGKVVGQVGQILLPMIAGIAATKADLTEWVYEQGLTALHLLLREDAEEIAGLKGKHEKERTHNHWGSTNGELSFGGRRIQVSRPRVRSKSGAEASLPHFEAFREEDPLPERVLNQILVGVSTRNYESSLDKPAAKLKSRGTSKSAASRHLVSQTTKKLEEYLSRRLEEFELAALMLDGLEVAGQTVVVTLGITIDGTKVPLGIWLGSTENSRVCTAMLQDLLERGLRVDESILCVVDGGKGIRKALVDVLGDLAVIQRCQIHKLRNLRSYLPKSRHAYVLQTMKEAYKCKSADKARKRLQALVSWLERNGYDEAAGSLREGMEETLTVVKLAPPALLRQSLATTNAIENLNGTIRRVSRNVKRWKSPSMVRRWTALGVVTAQKKFRRIKGYRHMGALVQRLEANRNLLTAMSLLPKSIHRCRRYPTKFNSGRDIPHDYIGGQGWTRIGVIAIRWPCLEVIALRGAEVARHEIAPGIDFRRSRYGKPRDNPKLRRRVLGQGDSSHYPKLHSHPQRISDVRCRVGEARAHGESARVREGVGRGAPARRLDAACRSIAQSDAPAASRGSGENRADGPDVRSSG